MIQILRFVITHSLQMWNIVTKPSGPNFIKLLSRKFYLANFFDKQEMSRVLIKLSQVHLGFNLSPICLTNMHNRDCALGLKQKYAFLNIYA